MRLAGSGKLWTRSAMIGDRADRNDQSPVEVVKIGDGLVGVGAVSVQLSRTVRRQISASRSFESPNSSGCTPHFSIIDRNRLHILRFGLPL